MNRENPDRRNFDVASISRTSKSKRANYIQDALHIDREKVRAGGEFVKVFADMFLKREVGVKAKAYF